PSIARIRAAPKRPLFQTRVPAALFMYQQTSPCGPRHSSSTQTDKLTSRGERRNSEIVTPRKSAATAHKWLFTSRIRPKVFSWRSSSTAVTRIKEAVAEVQKVAQTDPVTAAEGAVRLIERLSPALEHVDSSS